jgi:hypothetical protein
VNKIVIIIPAYNEADTIRDTVHAACIMPGIEEVVVVDDGSTDNTAFIAYEEGATVLQMENNSGKGAALNKAFKEIQADVYLLVDADLGATAKETKRLLEPIANGHADMSIAVMKAPPGHKGGFGLVMRLAKWGIEKLTGSKVLAPISGQRAIRREVLEAIGGFENKFGVEVALTIDALRKGFRVVEMELPLTHRLTDRSLSGFVHRAEQFMDIARALWKRKP